MTHNLHGGRQERLMDTHTYTHKHTNRLPGHQHLECPCQTDLLRWLKKTSKLMTLCKRVCRRNGRIENECERGGEGDMTEGCNYKGKKEHSLKERKYSLLQWLERQ